ncbi:MAG: type II secretion system protein [Thermodesulforhabdaceae bacterium]
MRNKKFGLNGFSLVELLAAIALVSIVLAIVFPQFASILKHSTSTRKVAKTQSDLFADLEYIFKEISLAGYGLPVSRDNLSRSWCVREGHSAVVVESTGNASESLIIYSAGVGNRKGRGRWGIVDVNSGSLSLFGVSGMLPPTSNSYVMIIDTADASLRKLGVFKVSNNGLATIKKYVSDEVLTNKIAYWIPTASSSEIYECYESQFYIESYSSDKPQICANSTSVLVKDQDPPDGGVGKAPILDCVKDLRFRLGCVDYNTGSVNWRTSCRASEVPKMVRVGMVVQASGREKDIVFPHSSLSLFSSLGSNSIVISLTEDERYYRWTTVEKTIFIPNVE